MSPNAVGVKLRLAGTESHPGPSRDAARCQLQLRVGQTAYRCGLTRVSPRALWSLEEVTPTASRPLRRRVPRSAALAGVCPVPWEPRDGPADHHRTPPGWHQAHPPPPRPPRRYGRHAARSPASADGGAPPRGMTPVHTRSWPQVGPRSGCVSSRRAHTVCQSTHTGTSTGG